MECGNDRHACPECSGDVLKFEDLPIVFQDTEHNGEWSKKIEREGTIRELLETFDIDDPGDKSEMTQVLRHLKRILQTSADRSAASHSTLTWVPADIAKTFPFGCKVLIRRTYDGNMWYEVDDWHRPDRVRAKAQAWPIIKWALLE